MLFARLMDQLIKTGTLEIIDATGRRHEFGDGTPPKAAIRLHDRRLHGRLFRNPALHTGEAYMDGTLTIEEGTLYDFLDIATQNLAHASPGSYVGVLDALRYMSRLFGQFNPVGRAKDNVAHHYDLSGKLYDLFLDRDRQYSCAYFDHPDQSLDDAQNAKKRHIAAKLVLDRPGLRVLDIGCGWGGLALYLAAETGAHVTGITLSEEQLKSARQRAAKAGLADRVSFELRDYREETGTYDRVVSVGMFEHVGTPHYPVFFAKLRSLLTPEGIALLHTIGRADGPGATNPWLRKYIFPGGYSPALSEVTPAIERQRLLITDIETLRLHYAQTLRAWRERFMRNRRQVVELYDERFARMWEFYLVGSELAFRNQYHVVYQIQMSPDVATVPLNRDYMFDWERGRGARSEHAA